VVLESPEPVVLEPPDPPAGLVLSVGSVESGGGSVVVGVLLVVELVGGSVVVVGGSVVVGGTVVLGGSRRGRLDGGGAVVEVVAWLLGGRVTVCPPVVVGGLVELAGETASRCGRVVVVVVWAVALATWPGVVRKPTTLPPIAPISIAVITLTQRRAATKEIGPKPGPPPVRAS
jgi:hypothetical protein